MSGRFISIGGGRKNRTTSMVRTGVEIPASAGSGFKRYYRPQKTESTRTVYTHRGVVTQTKTNKNYKAEIADFQAGYISAGRVWERPDGNFEKAFTVWNRDDIFGSTDEERSRRVRIFSPEEYLEQFTASGSFYD